jgi:alanine dehydrogenase
VRFISAAEIDKGFDFPALIDGLEAAFRADITIPERHHHYIPRARPEHEATILIMPAWTGGDAESFVGIKVITIFPENLAKNIPSLTGNYLLLAGDSGLPLAVLDGGILTRWRTAAASALAAKYLARENASTHLIVGAGALSIYFARAHASVRPIQQTLVWNRTQARAEKTAAEMNKFGLNARTVANLEQAVGEADIVTCVTGAEKPVLMGKWLKPGVHVDLVGAFKSSMRESDDEVIRRSRIFVDTHHALHEPGDLIEPLRDEVISETDIQGDLFELCRSEVKGRGGAEEITLFKSVGTALEDLAAAILAWKRLGIAAR